jgi:hypothetical protein
MFYRGAEPGYWKVDQLAAVDRVTGSAFGQAGEDWHVPAIIGDIRHSATTADSIRKALR